VLSKEDSLDPESLKFVCNLQKCNLAEIFDAKNLQQSVDLGVSCSIHNYQDKLKTAEEVLPHKCSQRGMMRVAHERKHQLKCRHPHILKFWEDALRKEFRVLKHTFTN
jgi:hypothetical protein